MTFHRTFWLAPLAAFLLVAAAAADVYHFDTGLADLQIGVASRPTTAGTPPKLAIEAADDFVLADPTVIDHATFTGLLRAGAGALGAPTVTSTTVEIFRLFPLDSASPPSGNVPDRTNSPGDNVFLSRDTTSGTLTNVTMTVLNAGAPVANSVVNAINPVPNQTTGGEGAIVGSEILVDVTFTPPLTLAAGHYYFVPQVEISGGGFYWLSSPKPIVSPGTPFAGDAEAWVRTAGVTPDWLRVGTDIIGGDPAPAYNASFSLDGIATPLPPPPPGVPALSSLGLLALALLLGGAAVVRLRVLTLPRPGRAGP